MTLDEFYRIAAQIDSASFEAAEDGQLAHAHELHEIAERIRRDKDLAAEALALRTEVLALREERDAAKRTSAVEIARRAARSIGGSDGL
jgi:hypothetical protein